MKTIEIEETVFQALEKRVQGFGDTPNDVIKRLIAEVETAVVNGENQSPPFEKQKSPIVDLVQSPQYLRGDARQRYFNLLRFLYQSDQSQFNDHFNGFRLGSRIQISTSKEDIENSGTSTHPMPLDGTPYFVLSNLSNDRKRAILDLILRQYRYSNDVIETVLRSIPDSGITRPRRTVF
jgi:negative modulator of initiation of replication